MFFTRQTKRTPRSVVIEGRALIQLSLFYICCALSRTNCTEIDILPEAESLLHIPAQNRFVPVKLDIYNPINVQGRRVVPFET